MTHPHHDGAKKTQAYKLRGIAGASGKGEYARDRAHRIAGVVAEDRRVVGNPSPVDQVEHEQKG